MPNTYSTLGDLFTAIANAIRGKTGSSSSIKADDFPSAIGNIPTGGDPSGATAVAGDILYPKTAVLADGQLAEGTIQSQAAQTIHPSTSDQTIAAGKYLAGTQTVKGVFVSNTLVAANVAAGVTVTIGDADDHDRIMEVVGTHLGGSGSAGENDVNFIDYDGTIVASYSAADFAHLSALPANPSHDGLTAQGWNWSLSDAKNYVASYGKLWIGQMYVTSDGKTRIYIHLEEGRLAPYLGIAINGSAEVDWGDGTSSTVTGSNTTTAVNTQHTYSAAGDYVIAISVTGSMRLVGHTSYGSLLLWKNSATASLNRTYQNAIQKIEIGANTSIGGNAFYNCYSIKSITIPYGVTTIGEYAFAACYSLASVTIPSGVTTIGGYTFSNCYSLASISLPNGVTSIYSSVFNNCYSLASVAIPSSVTTIGGYTFSNCYSLASIAIPNGVTAIYLNAFYNCYSLASVTISNDVTSIENNVFYNCYSLASVTIPSGVTSIGNYAFSACNGLGFIKFLGTTPPTVANSNAWANVPTDCIIYVPRGYLSAYTGATHYPSSSTYTYVEYDP